MASISEDEAVRIVIVFTTFIAIESTIQVGALVA